MTVLVLSRPDSIQAQAAADAVRAARARGAAAYLYLYGDGDFCAGDPAFIALATRDAPLYVCSESCRRRGVVIESECMILSGLVTLAGLIQASDSIAEPDQVSNARRPGAIGVRSVAVVLAPSPQDRQLIVDGVRLAAGLFIGGLGVALIAGRSCLADLLEVARDDPESLQILRETGLKVLYDGSLQAGTDSAQIPPDLFEPADAARLNALSEGADGRIVVGTDRSSAEPDASDRA